MSTNSKYLHRDHVVKMFPISFERYKKYDRVLSEENLIDWIRGIASNSSDLERNSHHSYVITEELASDFGSTTSERYIEFLIGGYYVKLSDRGFMEGSFGNGDIYAVITETSSSATFRALEGGEDVNSEELFKAVKLVSCDSSKVLDVEADEYKLHILTKTATGYSIPTGSKRATYAVDGGEIL